MIANYTIIADSSGLISLVSPEDKNHRIAKNIASTLKEPDVSMVVPGEIFTETVNVFGKKTSHEIAIKYGAMLLRTEQYHIIDTNEGIRISAFEKFQKQPKGVSFTDCIVMAFADEFETKLIFGFDESFFKNGYIRIGVDKA